VVALSLSGVTLHGAQWTGYVSDAACAAKQGSNPDHKACARSCIERGEAAVLVSGGKIYKLDKQDEAKKFAGDKVLLTGTVSEDGSTIKVDSIRKAE
jgi:hypothetical protein